MKTIFVVLFVFIICMTHQYSYAQDKTITAGGIDYRIKSFGQGPVTVIFESGISLPLETWFSIDDKVAKFAKVFLYDRAGIGKSGFSSKQRTIPQYVLELRQILQELNLSPPYVLVSHSMGGYIARYFTWKYPSEVMGLLLIDPAPESLYDKLSGKKLKTYLQTGEDYYSKKSKGSHAEWKSLYNNRNYMTLARIKDDIPAILLSSSGGNMAKDQKLIVNKHGNTQFIKIHGSHFIHNENPGIIVKHIKSLIEKVK